MSERTPFAGLRVVEISAGIPAAYCGKLFVDAGADVIKVEPPDGDPARHEGSASGGGALFGYLHAGKRSVGAGPGSAPTGADLVITDCSDGRTAAAVAGAVVVAVTPFGLDGPYVDAGVAANEFLLQALCGSIGSRGWPGETPFQAGGRPGEWVAGVYAAVAAAAALRHRRRTGAGELVDVSVFETMTVTMGGLGAVSASVLGGAGAATSRSLELPSIVPTADGLVGFCTITAQQFADFLVLIDRPDLIDDADLASFAGRTRRRAEFQEMVQNWAATRTTAEIVDVAVALRIPVAPIGTPGSVTEIDHFRERGVFVKNASGQLQPRVPYRSTGFATVAPGEPPPLGPVGAVTWSVPRTTDAPSGPGGPGLPLDGLRVVDFTAFWAGPCATHTLAALGADVIKVEGLRRPDGMRYSGGPGIGADRWWESGPVFLASNGNKRGVTLELGTEDARDLVLRLIATADLVVENFSPRVMGNLGLSWDAVREANPSVVMTRMPAFGLDGPWRDRVGFAQTMEQAGGMAWMTGFADGPPVIPRGVCDPLAGLHAAFASLAALEVRDATGAGMQVESTMVEAALNVAAEALLGAGAGGAEPSRDGNRGPGAAPQGVYRAAGADDWVALAVLDDAQWRALASTLGRPDLGGRADLADERGRRAAADELDAAIGEWVADRERGSAVAALRAAGVPAAPVNSAAELLTDPQLGARGFWEDVEHPVAGRFRTTGMPFRFAGVTGPWNRRCAPLLGEHNEEVLGGVLGVHPGRLRELADTHIIGTRPAGL